MNKKACVCSHLKTDHKCWVKYSTDVRTYTKCKECACKKFQEQASIPVVKVKQLPLGREWGKTLELHLNTSLDRAIAHQADLTFQLKMTAAHIVRLKQELDGLGS